MEQIKTNELVEDLVATIEDFNLCEMAISFGIDSYGEGDSVTERHIGNAMIGLKILSELDNRSFEYADTFISPEDLRMRWNAVVGKSE